jgi:glycosyltransferase involved in cell wall biosynthesis
VTRLVFITQQVDPAHPALAATVPQIRALSERVDEVVVLAGGGIATALPENCRVVTFAAATQARRGARFVAALAPELRPRPRAILAHMCPIYAVLAAPLARPLGVPIALWFAHWRPSTKLRAAEAVATRVLTVDPSSFPIPSRKLVPIGHGIDLTQFPCVDGRRRHGAFRALALGRYTAVKGYETMLRAARIATDAGLPLSLRIRGPVLTAQERDHRRDLEELHRELDLAGIVELDESVPRSEVARLLAESDVLVNNTRAGGADKVVYEAAATCTPVVASAPIFSHLLPRDLRFRADDADDLALRLRELATRDAAALAGLVRGPRAAVEAEHSLDAWADRVLAAL